MLGVVCAACTLLPIDSHLLLSFVLGVVFCIGLISFFVTLLWPQPSLGELCLSSSALGIVLWLALLCLDLYPSLTGIYLVGAAGVAMFFALPITLVTGIVRWRKKGPYWIAPFLICMCCFLLARSQWFLPPLAESVNNWQFRRHINDYSSIVDQVKRGLIPTTQVLREVNLSPGEPLPPGVTVVRAASWKPDGFVVEFTCSSDKVRVRKGFLFKGFSDSDTNADAFVEMSKVTKIRHMLGDWYSFEK